MPTAVAASTDPRRPAADASGLSLPGQKLLHRGQVSRPSRFEKFMLLPHRGSGRNVRRRGEDKKNGGFGCGSEIPLDLKLFPSPARVARKQKLPPPLDPTVPIHGAAGGKSLVQQHGTTTEQTSSDQSPESRPSLP